MKADYMIKNVWVYLTFRQCFARRNVAVLRDRFFEISDPDQMCEADRILDGSGQYMVPGLIDIHMHIESSMTYPEEFSRVVLPHGTTTVVADAHEIANVFGMEGIRAFMDQKTDMDIFYAIPSSVPSVGEKLETSGASLGEKEVEELLSDSRVLCLGEVMNFQSLVSEEEKETEIQRFIRMCREARGRDIRLEGHCPKISGGDLNHFIFAGVDADHTQQTPESVLEKTDLGMFLELQIKSLTPEVVDTVCKNSLYENIALITDDTMPDQLLDGQMDRVVRAAVKAGMPLEKAVYCATYTPARRMHLDDRGIIAPGKLADFILLNDLTDFRPAAVFKSGKLMYNMEKKPSKPHQTAAFPLPFFHSVHCRKACAEDFVLRIEENCSEVQVNVMKISTFGTATERIEKMLPVKNGAVCWQEAGLCLAVIFERHGKNGNIAYGLVEGAFKKPGAAASTWSHDSHNLFVLGNSIPDMVAAQNRVIELQGGYVVSREGKVQAEAALEIGGIISSAPVEELADRLFKVRTAMEALGYHNNNVIMSMSTLALPVSPALKMTDYGLLDVKTQNRVELIEKRV